jgi:fatty-acyl-CoA synthase
MASSCRDDRPSPTKAWLRALELTAAIAKNPARTMPVMIEELAERFGDSPALLGDRESLSYRRLADRSRRYARWALTQGLGRGARVCLLMRNRPEYMAIWLGLNLASGVVALLNTNLTGRSLAHSIDAVVPTHIIVAGDLVATLLGALPHVATGSKIWSHGDCDREFPRIDEAVERLSGDPLQSHERTAVILGDPALCIYTSGTTGLPKAAIVNHYRIMMWSNWFAGMMDTRPADRMYDCLPMYHSIGGVAAPGAVLVNGGSVAICEKFSAQRFWEEVRRWDCTLMQYIGEICRYLVNTPPQPGETEHRIRLACGNGLRADVWEVFKSRFRIPQILEFYAATEGNVTLFNYEEKPGAIGRIPPFLAHRFRTSLVRFDLDKGEPARGDEGRCVPCGANEVGEAIGPSPSTPADPGSRFEGYTSRRETEKKILRDVFEAGDAWFRTGDLMRKDAQGYFYFVDRVGDTYRWKGENVATSEVAEAITRFPGILEANVYGVVIPRTEGRAGMAALVTRGDLDLAAFRRHLIDCLPSYARPLFLRIRCELEVTATFKHKKAELVREGYDPLATTDAIYFEVPQHGSFVRVDTDLYARIVCGAIRL